ncbi:Endonuclease/exonuclease/phosphatase family protein [Sulfidibacter corallicola]|uniref:Endonuclease/exonuclease/phosphatase family protein n=1 Tax=Sulfidibacter corallicola TaxID=2818388 RepID=A0A8A4TJZ3_SULCO|nr:endonuclease/exonuclease/phosphatase family protein [Sulfidibacter corallicola]QTD50339.1 endonuclease/exonuclease/phosphatase family protein [Sulfidibacter corallicola]
MNLRIATYNIENLSDRHLAQRIPYLVPTLQRLRADVLCLQEVHAQDGRLDALHRLLEGTVYGDYHLHVTRDNDGHPFSVRNLVTLSRYPIVDRAQILHDLVPPPRYSSVTAIPPPTEPEPVPWPRPVLHTCIALPQGCELHVFNLHFKSKHPTPIAGQQIDRFTWKSPSAWAEGFFLSSMKRVGQAIEVRMMLDRLMADTEAPLIAVCGDFNAESHEVPIQALQGRVEDTGNPEHGMRLMVPCENAVPAPSRHTLFHQGRANLLDHLLVSRHLLARHAHSEIHNEILHDESIAFADDRKYPESDHAPMVATFLFD